MPSSKPKTTRTHIGEVTLTELTKSEQRAVQAPKGSSVSRVAGQNIVTVELDKGQYVQSFQPSKLIDRKAVHYSEVAKTFANADDRRNARFSLSELAKRALSVEAEEEARIEGEVEKRLSEKFATLSEEVRQKAYREGFAVGKNDARVEVINEAKPLLERFDGVIKQLEAMRFDVFKANEELLIQMIYQVARSIILKELKEDHDYTKRLLIHLLERVGTRENIKVYLGEEAFSASEVIKTGLVQFFGELKNISVEVDPDIKDAGCTLETDFGEVDARIEVQLENAAHAIGAQGGAS